jgi:glycine/D-amino acid oxidase-like deaminating enzyme
MHNGSDVIGVGAGIVDCCIAYHLANGGRFVTLIVRVRRRDSGPAARL